MSISDDSGPDPTGKGPSLRRTVIPYTVTLLLFLVGSYFPEQRVWGVNTWGYFAGSVRWLFFAAGLAVVFAVAIHARRTKHANADSGSHSGSRARYAILAASFVLMAGTAFYFFRARTYFLGDGYLQLATLANDVPLLKGRDFGEMQVHVWLKSLLGGEGRHAALLSYQLLSVAAGIIFATATAFVAAVLFARNARRLLFLIGMCTGGYALLFFGYVENYSLLCLSIGLFTLTGMLIAAGRLSRWWIVLPLATSAFFHILGVTLVPAALYLLAANSKLGRILSGRPVRVRALLAAAVALAAGVAFYHFYTTDYFFRFAFVPLIHNRFTVEGYTLFSVKHLADYANLLIMLFPAVLLLPLATRCACVRLAGPDTRIRFLAILVASTLGAAFIFEAKLGMPRDWDLFSFPGIPLAALFYALAFHHRRADGSGERLVVLALALSLVALFPRVAMQYFPENGVERFVHHILLDPLKNRSGAYVLQQYYKDGGDSTTVAGIRARRAQDYPEERWVYEAGLSFSNGDTNRAKELSRLAIAANPTHSSGWLNLGRVLTSTRQYDSALEALRIADGLNPYSAGILGELGIAYFNLKKWDKAEQCWRREITIDPEQASPIMALARLYQMEGKEKEYMQYLIMAESKENALASFSLELGDQYLKQAAYELAAEAYSKALARGVDTAMLESRLKANPQLREYLSR